MFIAIVLYSLLIMHFANAEVVQYKQIVISDEELDLSDISFTYDFLVGKIAKVHLDKKHNKVIIKDAVFDFEDIVNKKWSLKVTYGLFEKQFKEIRKINISSQDGAIISIDKIDFNSISEKIDFDISNVYFTPCKNVFCWNVQFDSFDRKNSCSIVKGLKFGVNGIQLPWLDLEVNSFATSGFLIPSLKKDEFDGLLLKIPYYIHIDDYNDFKITPAFGQNLGVELNYRSLLNHDIVFLNCDIKYLGTSSMKRGAYFNIKNEHLNENDGLDMDLLLVTSREYAKYWDNKHNNQRRAFVPSYVYYTYDNWRFGTFNLIPLHINDIGVMIPKIVYHNRFRVDNYVWRIEGLAAAYAFRDKNIFNFDDNMRYQGSLLSSIGYSNNFLGLLTLMELGCKVHNHTDYSTFSPFAISSFRLPTIRFDSNFIPNLVPYLDSKLIISVGKIKASKWSRCVCEREYLVPTSVYENIENKIANSMIKWGVLVPYDNFEFDIGVLKDSKGDYAIFGVGYANEYLYFSAKDHMKNFDDHHVSLNVGIDHEVFDFSSQYSVFFFNNVMNQKISSQVKIKFSSAFSVAMNVLCKIRPEFEMVQSGVQFVGKTSCWEFSFGLSYGSNALDYQDTDQKTMLTFAIGINGLDQFKNAIDRIEMLRYDLFKKPPDFGTEASSFDFAEYL